MTWTFRSGKTVRLSRYCLLMLPAPMTATPTGPLPVRAVRALMRLPLRLLAAAFRKARLWAMPSKMSPE